ncbi:unnamed protein product, partial [Staurois parvus]
RVTVCKKKIKKKPINNNIKKIKFWSRFMMKDYLFAKFYKKNTFFLNFWTFSFTNEKK